VTTAICFAPLFAFRFGILCASFTAALFVSLICSVPVRMILERRGHYRSAIPGCLTLVAIPVFTMAFTMWGLNAMVREGRGVTAAEENASLLLFKVATNVDFRTSAGGSEAEFDVSAADFIEWTRKNGWEVEVFQRDPDWPMPQVSAINFIPSHVRFGFCFLYCRRESCLDSTQGYFDHDTGRAKVSHWLN
jgi:hypothetical protein